MTWTRFMDMHSGGGTKVEPYQYIYIEATENKAKEIFQQRFDRDPDHETCSCCGQDYSISEEGEIDQATGCDRGCSFDGETKKYVETDAGIGWRQYLSLPEYLKMPDVLFIHAIDIITCTCEMNDVMIHGCKCGAMKAEKELRAS